MFARSLSLTQRVGHTFSRTYCKKPSLYAEIIPSFSAPVYQKEAEVVSLPNGMKVASTSIDSNMVSIALLIRGGSRFETAENNGASFLLQQAGFLTKSKAGKTIGEEIERIGGVVKVEASREDITYNLCVEKESLGKGVALLSELVNNFSSITSEQLDQVRDRALSEKNFVEDNLDQRARNHLHSIIFQGSSLGQTPQGTTENIKNLSATAVNSFAKEYYGSGNIVIGAAGNFGENEFVDVVEKHFAVPKVNTATPPPASYFGSSVSDRDDSNDNVHITIGFPTVPESDEDYVPVQVLRRIYGYYSSTSGANNNHSPYLAEFMGEHQLCESYNTFDLLYSDHGVFGVSARTQGKHLDDLSHSLVNEFVRVAYKSTPSEFARAKKVLTHDILSSRDGIDTLANSITQRAVNGEPLSFAEAVDQVQTVTADQVKGVAQKYFVNSEPGLVGIGSTRRLPDYNQLRGWTHWWGI